MQSKYDIKNPSKTHVILQLVEVVDTPTNINGRHWRINCGAVLYLREHLIVATPLRWCTFYSGFVLVLIMFQSKQRTQARSVKEKTNDTYHSVVSVLSHSWLFEGRDDCGGFSINSKDAMWDAMIWRFGRHGRRDRWLSNCASGGSETKLMGICRNESFSLFFSFSLLAFFLG